MATRRCDFTITTEGAAEDFRRRPPISCSFQRLLDDELGLSGKGFLLGADFQGGRYLVASSSGYSHGIAWAPSGEAELLEVPPLGVDDLAASVSYLDTGAGWLSVPADFAD